MELIDGKSIANSINDELKSLLANQSDKRLRFAIINASNDEASKTYIKLKIAKAKEIGIDADLVQFSDSVRIEEILSKIQELNDNKEINGIIVQLPLFDHIKDFKHNILNAVKPTKDIDGLSAVNLGLVTQNFLNGFIPATVDAVLECIKYIKTNDSSFDMVGKNVLVINNSDLIGKPLTVILSTMGATVTIANEFSDNLDLLISQNSIVISATGKGQIIKPQSISKGAICIDITSINTDGKVTGDFIVDEEFKSKASYYTPVPGGIGPLTIACLLRNLSNTLNN